METKIIKIASCAVFIMLVIIILYYLFRTDETWKLSYLKKVYPLGTNLSIKQFNNLEMYYTNLLPESFKNDEAFKTRVYTAKIPGPSCGELPCGCKDGIPDVSFDVDPIFNNKWPVCNVSDELIHCCESVKAYRQCLTDKTISWAGSGDTWTGPKTTSTQPPPSMTDIWKPTLWPKYTAAINYFPPRDWESYHNSLGDPDNSWIEGVHSAFFPTNTTYGVWFYKTVGSGIFINLGKTLRARNKLDVLIKLGWTIQDIANFINRPIPIKGTLLYDPSITLSNSGLGGPEKVYFWLAGQYLTNIKELMDIKKLSLEEILTAAANPGSDYDINRINTSGTLDSPAFYMARQQGYNSVQYTVQPNIYNGFTTEIMIVGDNTTNTAFTSIDDMPNSGYRVLDPNNLPDSPTLTVGEACNYKYPLTCSYCEQVTATTSELMGCKESIFDIKQCK